VLVKTTVRGRPHQSIGGLLGLVPALSGVSVRSTTRLYCVCDILTKRHLQWDWLEVQVQVKDVLNCTTTVSGEQSVMINSTTQQPQLLAALSVLRTLCIFVTLCLCFLMLSVAYARICVTKKWPDRTLQGHYTTSKTWVMNKHKYKLSNACFASATTS